jgi:hypothetical protein
MTAEEEADDDFDLNSWSGGPDPDEQEAILMSYMSMNRTEDEACAREEGNQEQWRHVVEASILRAEMESARRLFAEEQQRLLKDAVEGGRRRRGGAIERPKGRGVG